MEKKSLLVLPSHEELRAARRELKKKLEEFFSEVWKSWPKSLRASNLGFIAETIEKEFAVMENGIKKKKKIYKKKIAKYGEEIRSRCARWELGKFVRKLERTENKVSRLRVEEKKLGKLRRRFDEFMKQLDRASDVINYLSSEKFLFNIKSVIKAENSAREVRYSKNSDVSSLPEVKSLDRDADVQQNSNNSSDKDLKNREADGYMEVKLKEESTSSSSTERSADVVTKILFTESEITCHQEIKCEAPRERLENRQSENGVENAQAALQREKSLAEKSLQRENEAGERVRRMEFHSSRPSKSEEERESVIKNEEQRDEREELRKFQMYMTSERNYVPLRPFDPGGDSLRLWFREREM